MQINNKNNPSFTAVHISNAKNIVKNVETSLEIFELNAKNDKTFLKKLPDKIQMETLMPNLTKDEYVRWHEMLEYATYNAQLPDRKTLLAVKDNQPCGILVYLAGKNKYHLDCICTWPIEYGKKVALAGKTLFQELFNRFSQSKATKITLEAITNGPYDTVSKYKNLGFVACGGFEHKILMETNTAKVKQTLKHLDNLINTEKITNGQNEKLNLRLDI